MASDLESSIRDAGQKLADALKNASELKVETLWVAVSTDGPADFSGARLAGADFSYACLDAANLEKADLTGANLHGITERDTQWGQASLKDVKRTDQDRLEAENWQPPRETS